MGVHGKNYLDFEPIEFAISGDAKNWISYLDDPDLEGIYCYQAPDVQPATQTDTLKKVGLQDGQRLLSTSYDMRQLTMNLILEDAVNEGDALLGYDALQQFLVTRKPYWICFDNWPQRMYYVKAKLNAPTFNGDHWMVAVVFTDLIGLSRSVNTSLNYTDNAGFGNNIPVQELQFVFTSNSFTVYNPSNIMIDPQRRGHELKITFEGSSSGNLKLTNQTTNTEFGRSGELITTEDGDKAKPSNFNGTYVINGIRPTLNGESDYLNCDGGVITLDPGKNEFKLDNFSGKVSFDFPFWWLS